ncbi:MAG: glutathione S-transferase, partial [Rhodospirillales bacterium]|nr:glutathione S-transferase [Rhodospirillales bacterium]
MIHIYYWLTDNGRKALQVIEETGLPHRLVPVNLTKKEQFSPEFLAINPGHKIPALVDDDGPGGIRVALGESGAILKYVAEKAGGALYPAAPASRAKVDHWFFYGTSTFTPLAQQYGHFWLRAPEDVPAAKKHYEAQLRDMFGIFDRHLAASEYMADEYSIADIACYPDVRLHGKLGIGLDDYPSLNRWHDTIAARPAVERAWAVA